MNASLANSEKDDSGGTAGTMTAMTPPINNDNHLCRWHKSMFSDLFAIGTNEDWSLSNLGKSLNSSTFGGGKRVLRKRRLEPLPPLSSSLSSSLSYGRRREMVTFAVSNRGLFIGGCRRSILNTYHRLLRLIYDRRYYGICREDADGGGGGSSSGRRRHVTFGVATYASKASTATGEDTTMSRFAFRVSYRLSAVACAVEPLETAETSFTVRDITITNAAAYVNMRRRAAASARWCMTTSLLLSPSTTSAAAATRPSWTRDVEFVRRHDGNDVEKLLDHRFSSAAEAWFVLASVIDWCRTVHDEIGVYPVRRSVWDLAFCRSGGDGGDEGDDEWCVVSTNGMIDVGDISAFVYTLRIFVLAIYLGCSYGGISRATISANDRASNRSHDCVFPPKTSGVYHALFHSSIAQHRLICAQYGSRRRGDEVSGAADNDSSSNYVTPEHWLDELFGLCDKACERYDLKTLSQ